MVEPDILSDGVRIHHHRIEPDRWDDVVVVGDVHGCRNALEKLIASIDTDSETLFVFVGDLVRKGPDSHGVVEFVRERSDMVSVRGNNESKVIEGDKTVPGLTRTDLAYLESLPVAISWGDNLVVHGGVDPREAISDHTVEDLLTMRSFGASNGYERPYWFEEYTDSPRVFFGHTVLDRPFATDAVVGLDTGCVYGGQLTAYVVGEDRFVSVDPATTHQSRSSDSIVRPRVGGVV